MKTPTMKWRKTWHDRDDDFLCIADDGAAIGRMYKHFDGRWNWHMNAEDLPRSSGCAHGHPREIAALVEGAYYRASKA